MVKLPETTAKSKDTTPPVKVDHFAPKETSTAEWEEGPEIEEIDEEWNPLPDPSMGDDGLGDPTERRQDGEIERLRAQFDAARADLDQARAALADKAVVLQEIARLRDLLTPRTYREGDPKPDGMVLWWDLGWWVRLMGCDLDHGDRWLPLPPPPEEDKG